MKDNQYATLYFSTMLHSMKSLLLLALLACCAVSSYNLGAQPLKEQQLWPGGIPNNPVTYVKEKVRSETVHESSPSRKNRVFSQVSVPTYTLIQADKDIATGVAIVICPGGGFRDVWFDREGIDFAMWLANKGITSLVLKYRTFNADTIDFTLKREVYNKEVYADAKQAIHILRSRAQELGIDKNKIGIGGYSAGGALSLLASLEIFEDTKPEYAKFEYSTQPDFTCLIYPGIRDEFYEYIQMEKIIPPMFLINGAQDNITPADNCIKLYSALSEANVPAELHIYSKGKHGFDSGIGRGYGIALWQDSFINWLKDIDILD